MQRERDVYAGEFILTVIILLNKKSKKNSSESNS